LKKLFQTLTILILIVINIPAFGQDVLFTSCPRNLQLFPRDEQDSSMVEIAGYVTSPGYDSVKVLIDRNGINWWELSQPLVYVGDSSWFNFQPKIHAELSEYDFIISIDGVIISEIDNVVCGDAFLIEGQSNAEAYGNYPLRDRWVRSFGNKSSNRVECYEDTTWYIAKAAPWPNHEAMIGIWGMRMAYLIVENFGIPVCIINGAKGGTHITEHFKDETNPYNLETIYGRHLYRTTKAGVKDKIKTVIWHQGEADTWYNFMHNYHHDFDVIFNDWQEDYPSVENVYIFQLRHSFYCGDAQPELRERQRQMALFDDNIKIMSTANLIGHDGLHYNADGYEQMGDWIYPLIARDFYSSTDTLYINPPDIQEIYYTSASMDTLAMVFDQPVFWPDEPYWGEVMEDYIFLDNNPGYVLEGFTNPRNDNEILLVLSEPVDAGYLTYTANAYYRAHWELYEGPWIVNRRGIGALIFYRFPITEYSDSGLDSKSADLDREIGRIQLNLSPNPFNPSTTLNYQLPIDSNVELAVNDVMGREIAKLVNEYQNAGNHEVIFDAKDLVSGVYFVRLTVNSGQSMVRKMVLMK